MVSRTQTVVGRGALAYAAEDAALLIEFVYDDPVQELLSREEVGAGLCRRRMRAIPVDEGAHAVSDFHPGDKTREGFQQVG